MNRTVITFFPVAYSHGRFVWPLAPVPVRTKRRTAA